MKVLLDECVDWRLSREIVGHEARTVRQMGWTGVKNGELLPLAVAAFDVFITVDRNLSFQQNVGSFPIAVIILEAKTNRLDHLKALVPQLLAILQSTAPSTIYRVSAPQ
jgi:hypothetical protein